VESLGSVAAVGSAAGSFRRPPGLEGISAREKL
jgi:hypothetical protein